MLPRVPPRHALRQWWRAAAAALGPEQPGGAAQAPSIDSFMDVRQDAAEARSTRHTLRRPAKDPIRVIKALKFGNHLKSALHMEDALDDGVAYAFPSDEETGQRAVEVPKEQTQVHYNTLYRGRLRLDATACLLERREIAEMMKSPNELASIHLFSDASAVTGTEVQGMVLQFVYACGAVAESVLPAVSLAHGFYRFVDKVMAFVWALWLVAGPAAAAMRFILGKVRSITTDNGNELRLLDAPDLASVFQVAQG